MAAKQLFPSPEAPLGGSIEVVQLRKQIADLTAKLSLQKVIIDTLAREASLARGLHDLDLRMGALREHSLRAAAERDTLTGLLNKEAWKTAVTKQLEARRPVAMLHLDLDEFKQVNDRLGHPTGDKLLAEWGEFIVELFRRHTDIATGRTGGDECSIAVPLDSNAARAENPYEAADRLYEYTRRGCDAFTAERGGLVLAVGFGVSVGIAVSTPEHPLSFETLFGQADESMYEEKRYGR